MMNYDHSKQFMQLLIAHIYLTVFIFAYSPSYASKIQCKELFNDPDIKKTSSFSSKLFKSEKVQKNLMMQEYVDAGNWPFLLEQRDPQLKDRMGACGVVCAINIIQLLRTESNLEPLPNLAEIINNLHDKIPSIKNGLTSEGLALVLEFFVKTYSPKSEVLIRSQSLEADLPVKVHGLTRLKNMQISALENTKHKIQIIAFNVQNSKGQFVGAHFVLLAGKTNDQIEVYEPGDMLNPQKIRIEEVAYQDVSGLRGKMIELIPNGQLYYQTYGTDIRIFVHSVITVD